MKELCFLNIRNKTHTQTQRKVEDKNDERKREEKKKKTKKGEEILPSMLCTCSC